MTRQRDPILDVRPRLRPGVLLHADAGRGSYVVANLYCPSRQKLRRSSEDEISILQHFTGEQTVEQISSQARFAVWIVAETIRKLEQTAPECVDLIGDTDYERRARHSIAALQLHRKWLASREVLHAEKLERYHLERITDALEQFERIETTVSHLFREPSAALNGMRYGEALCRKLVEQFASNSLGVILEVGAGTGLLAKHFLDALAQEHPDLYQSVQYCILELSPSLRIEQQNTLSEHSDHLQLLSGNIIDYQFGDRRFDLVLANEMIADLPVESASDDTPAALVNAGAIEFIKRLPDLLTETAGVLLTEYGSVHGEPLPVPLGEHSEYTVQFSALREAAEHCGFLAELSNLGEYLQFDPNYETIHDHSFNTLSMHLLPFLGKSPIPRRSYGREEIRSIVGSELLQTISNVQFVELKNNDILSPFGFYALCLKRG